MSFHQLAQAIQKTERFYIFTHRDPDGDALGSAGALLELLTLLGKKAWFILEKPLDPSYARLLDFQKIVVIHENQESCSLLPGLERDLEEPESSVPTLVIGVDYHDPLRLAELKRLMDPDGPLAPSKTVSRAIIDHHKPVFLDPEIDFKIIDPSTSSCGALIHDLFVEMDVEITLQAARCLYWAVVCDTAKFSTQATSSRDLEIAAKCLKIGVEVSTLQSQLEERFEMSQVKRALQALLKATSYLEDKFWMIQLSFDAYQKAGTGALRWVHSVMPGLKEPVAWLVALEEFPGRWRLSARSRKDVRLGELFAEFGGGGHGAAAGVTIEGNPEAVIERLRFHLEKGLL
jgi:phosphoesterase RecJ-like protein